MFKSKFEGRYRIYSFLPLHLLLFLLASKSLSSVKNKNTQVKHEFMLKTPVCIDLEIVKSELIKDYWVRVYIIFEYICTRV